MVETGREAAAWKSRRQVPAPCSRLGRSRRKRGLGGGWSMERMKEEGKRIGLGRREEGRRGPLARVGTGVLLILPTVAINQALAHLDPGDFGEALSKRLDAGGRPPVAHITDSLEGVRPRHAAMLDGTPCQFLRLSPGAFSTTRRLWRGCPPDPLASGGRRGSGRRATD
jgi:hypothetical protein